MPSLAEAIRDARRKQLEREGPYQQRMQRLYAQVIDNLEADMRLLSMRIQDAIDMGEEIGPDWLRRQNRYQRLLADADREFASFAQQGEYVIREARVQAVRGGATEAWEMMDASGITQDYTGGRINTLAVQEALAATESAPIRAILASYGAQGAKTIEDTLLDGMARGKSPRAMIRDIRNGLNSPYSAARLEALVRTESMRAYRGSLNEQYAQRSHLIAGYRWSAAKSTRTCLACLGMDGSIRAEPWNTFHVSCRCINTPVPKGSTYKYQTGEEWLRNQPDAVQAKMMPSADALKAWKRGDIGLSDFVGHHESAIYGRSVYQRSGRQVLERATPKVPAKPMIPEPPQPGSNIGLSREEAIEWAKGSEFTGEVYHATDARNIDDLLENGFDTDLAGSGVGSVFGDAIYVTQDPGDTLAYYLSGDNKEAVAGRIRTFNPLRVDAEDWMTEDVLHDEIFELIGDVGDDSIETVADLLIASDYDSIIITQIDGFDRSVGGSQIILQSADQVALYPIPDDVMTSVNKRVYGVTDDD